MHWLKWSKLKQSIKDKVQNLEATKESEIFPNMILNASSYLYFTLISAYQ